LVPVKRVEQSIYLIRGEKVMLDEDLAELYGVETRILTRAVRRNLERFPEDFAFPLSLQEFRNLKSQTGISSWGGRRKLPWAFTEQGIAMLSSVLRCARAVQVNIQIMRAFVKLRELMLTHRDLARKLAVHLSEIDVAQPDLIAIASKSAHLIGELKIEGPPELLVEILSPSTRRLDRGAKRVLYESAGVLEYWIIDPEENSLCQHTLAEGRYSESLHAAGEVRSTAFPGFSFDLESIF